MPKKQPKTKTVEISPKRLAALEYQEALEIVEFALDELTKAGLTRASVAAILRKAAEVIE